MPYYVANSSMLKPETFVSSAGPRVQLALEQSNAHAVELQADLELDFIGGTSGQIYTVRIVNPDNAAYVVAWPANVLWPTHGTAPSPGGAGYIDIYTFYFDGTYFYNTVFDSQFSIGMQFAPESLSGLILDLDGNDTSKMNSGTIVNGGDVETWDDSSPANNNASQFTVSLEPNYLQGQLNGYGAVKFNQSVLALNNAVILPANAGWTIVCLMKFDGFGTSYNYFLNSTSTTTHTLSIGVNPTGTAMCVVGEPGEWTSFEIANTFTAGKFNIVTIVYDGVSPLASSSFTAYVNRAPKTSFTGIGGGYGTGTNIGAPDDVLEPNYMFKGSIARALVYDRALTLDELNQINAWANSRFKL